MNCKKAITDRNRYMVNHSDLTYGTQKNKGDTGYKKNKLTDVLLKEIALEAEKQLANELSETENGPAYLFTKGWDDILRRIEAQKDSRDNS